MKALSSLLLASLALVTASAAEPTTFKLPSVGGGVMTADNVTLIVSVTSKGELAYFDTMTDKELKRVEVDFQPTCMALQKDRLFVGAKGASMVYMLEAKTGKELKSFKLPGEPVQQIACHPTKGLIYASNSKLEVFSIDPAAGKVLKTDARGHFLAVDPVEGNFLYTGNIKPPENKIIIRGGKNGELIIVQDEDADRALMLKYTISGDTLKMVDGTDNAAIGAGGAMHLSPDGKNIAFIAGGGWWSRKDPKHRVGIAVFSTDDLKTMRGAVDVGAPQNLMFHPVLKMGVGLGNNVDLHFFNPKSLAVRSKTTLKRIHHTFWLNLLTFGGQGTKIVHLQGENLTFVPLELSEDDKAALKQHYGKGDK